MAGEGDIERTVAKVLAKVCVAGGDGKALLAAYSPTVAGIGGRSFALQTVQHVPVRDTREHEKTEDEHEDENDVHPYNLRPRIFFLGQGISPPDNIP
jgi:hypothetical protein